MSNIQHLAIIMDGNRRWAKDNSLPSFEGHRRGYDKMKEVGDWCLERGIKYFTVYAFSTENWKRAQDEVAYLMDLLYMGLTKEVPVFMAKGIRLKVIGLREGLPEKLLRAIEDAEKTTAENTKGTLNIAINYGGRSEILAVAKKLIAENISPDEITEEKFSSYMGTSGQPDPDMIIRTSGEQRLSGFLTWQGVYSELYFCKNHWPSFTEADLDMAIQEYDSRQRRFGGS